MSRNEDKISIFLNNTIKDEIGLDGAAKLRAMSARHRALILALGDTLFGLMSLTPAAEKYLAAHPDLWEAIKAW